MTQDYKIKGSPVQGLVGAALVYFVGLAAVALYGPSAKIIETQLHLDALELGILLGAPSLLGAVLRIPFGASVERNGGKTPNIILLCLAFMGILGLTLSGQPSSFTQLLIFGAIAGCGVATFSVSLSQISYWYSQAKQGRSNAIYGGVSNISAGLASLWIPIALFSWGDRITYLIWLVYIGIAILIYILVGRNAPYFQLRRQGANEVEARVLAAKAGQELFPAGRAVRSLSATAKYWQTWVLVVIYFTTLGGFLALTEWFPNYWQTVYGLKLFPDAVGLTAIFSVGASLMRVVGGLISDKIGGEQTSILAMSLLFVATMLMSFSFGNFALSVLGLCLIAVSMGVSNAATFKILPSVIPNAIGGASGWVGGLGALGGFVFPILQSLFVTDPQNADQGYQLSFLVYVVAAGLSGFLLAIMLAASGSAGKSTTRQAI